MRIEGERMQQDSYVETSRFFSVSRSIATPFLCFFSLSFFVFFSLSSVSYFVGRRVPRTMHSNAVVYTAVHKGREEDERDANRRRGTGKGEIEVEAEKFNFHP